MPSHCNLTYHKVDELRNGLDEGPDPLPVGLWVDASVQPADDSTPRALLRVDFQEVEGPEEVPRAAPARADLFAKEE